MEKYSKLVIVGFLWDRWQTFTFNTIYSYNF